MRDVAVDDVFTGDYSGFDLIIIALFPDTAEKYFSENADKMDKNTLVTDVCGIKGSFSERMRKIAVNNGMRYMLSPKALTWDDENYYMIAYDKDADMLKHFRVDKMEDISVEDVRADSSKAVDKFDLAVYTKQVFGMYGGDTVNVRMRFDDSLIGVVVDRFSDKVFIQPHSDGTFTMSAEVMLSPQFYGWLFSFGDKARIVSPKAAKEGFCDYLRSVGEFYN